MNVIDNQFLHLDGDTKDAHVRVRATAQVLPPESEITARLHQRDGVRGLEVIVDTGQGQEVAVEIVNENGTRPNDAPGLVPALKTASEGEERNVRNKRRNKRKQRLMDPLQNGGNME